MYSLLFLSLVHFLAPANAASCFCDSPFGGRGEITVGSGGILFPATDDVLIANQPILIRWDNSLKSGDADAAHLSLKLYNYLGECTGYEPGQTGTFVQCNYSEPVTQALLRVPNTGAASWTPPANLTSRNDYMVTGCLSDTRSCIVLGSGSFTILSREGDTPLEYPNPKDVFAALKANASASASATSTTGLAKPSTTAGTNSSATTPASGNGERRAQVAGGMRLVGLLSWLCYALAV